MRPRFDSLSRRAFVGWLGALPAARGLRPLEVARRTVAATRALDPAILAALAGAVLPSAMGAAATRRAAASFADWARGYAPGAELDHPYGSGDLSHAPADPAPAWGAQLAALEREARAAHGRSFATLGVAERQALVRAAVDAALSRARAGRAPSANDVASGAMPATPASLPAVAEAPHVAVALLAHFYDSSEALDLCYGAAIGRQTCRPLAAQRARPVQLTRATRRG